MQLFCFCWLLGVFIGVSNAENASDAIMQADFWNDFTDGIKGKLANLEEKITKISGKVTKLDNLEEKITKISGKVTKLEAAPKFKCINYSNAWGSIKTKTTKELPFGWTFKNFPSWSIAMFSVPGSATAENHNIVVMKDKVKVDISSDVSASITLRMIACGN